MLEKNINKNKICQWLGYISIACIVFNFIVVSNIAYLNLYYKFEKSYSLATEIGQEIRKYPNYVNIPVAIIGQLGEKYYPSTNITSEFTDKMVGSSGNNILVSPNKYQAFLENYYNIKIKLATNNIINEIKTTSEYKEMPNWPNEGYSKIINNVIVIKLSK